jgi:excisionase family DNA binding protein
LLFSVSADGLGSNRARTYVPSEDRLLTVQEVAARMRVSNMTVYRLIQAGDLRATRVGRSYRLRQGDVEAYLSRSAV